MHCYCAETGEPRHTVKTKKGAKNPERPSDIRDLRANNWYPSVTTIISDIASPDLENWRINEHIKAAWDIPVIHEETFEGWSRLVRERATKGTTDASDFGSRAHKALELAIQGKAYDTSLEPYIAGPLEWFQKTFFGIIHTEHTTVNRAIGFAGQIDIRCHKFSEEDNLLVSSPVILDWKTKGTKKDEPIKVPETYPWQVAAYHVSEFGDGQRNLHEHARACNVFISSTEPGRFEPVWYSREQLEEGWEAFKLCHRLYCIRNKWKPKIAQ